MTLKEIDERISAILGKKMVDPNIRSLALAVAYLLKVCPKVGKDVEVV